MRQAIQLNQITIKKVHEIWNWKEKTNELFKDYIDLWLKIKVECSGYPSSCDTDEKKNKFVDDYFINTGIQLDKEKLAKGRNEGARSVSKLCQNCIYGKLLYTQLYATCGLLFC